jgi:hypothetical protein
LTKLRNPVSHAEQLLRWWHQHQTDWLLHEADAIRNGLLQDLFVVRRKLELLEEDPQACLADIDHLYEALETLGDRLSSPFVHDSLPLAMQQVLAAWQDRLPIQADLPTHWSVESAEDIRLVLSILDYLLTSLGQLPHPPRQFVVDLAESAEGKYLTLRIDFVDAVPLSLRVACEASDWTYRLSTFEVLTGGTTHYQPTANSLEWQLHW